MSGKKHSFGRFRLKLVLAIASCVFCFGLTYSGQPDPVPISGAYADPHLFMNRAAIHDYSGAIIQPFNVAVSPRAEPSDDEGRTKRSEPEGNIPSLRIQREQSRIKLRGAVASQEEKKILLGMIEAAFPGFRVSDKTKIVADIQETETRLSGFSFALRQLALMRNGNASISLDTIRLSGVAESAEAYEQVQKAVKSQLPQGVVLGALSLRPPTASYIWLAQYQAGSLTITGHVPDKSSEAMLSSVAEQLFPSAIVKANVQVEDGAPENWVDAALLSLRALSYLQSGSVSLSDQTIKIDGLPASNEDAEKLALINGAVPEGYFVENEVMQLERTYLDVRGVSKN
jgi:hypothetical protein